MEKKSFDWNQVWELLAQVPMSTMGKEMLKLYLENESTLEGKISESVMLYSSKAVVK